MKKLTFTLLCFTCLFSLQAQLLYGLNTDVGGPGALFSFDVGTNAFNRLKEFGGIDGEQPFGSLVQAKDGKLYGMTGRGGKNYAGVIFSFDVKTNTYSRLKDFGNGGGERPFGNLVEANNGKFYGMTIFGGPSDASVLFSFDPTTKEYVIYEDFLGGFPYGSLIQANDGKLYGMTTSGGGSGDIFSFDPVNSKQTRSGLINGRRILAGS